MSLNVKNRIVQKGEELFKKFGVRSVTMDDIARQLGISKKTIYQFFPDKDALVRAVMHYNLDKHHEDIEQCCGQGAANAVEELLNVIDRMVGILREYNPTMIYDLQKYFPKIWLMFKEFRDSFVLNKIRENLIRGINEGLYRSDFDMDIIAIMRLWQTDMCFNADIYPPSKFNLLKVMEQTTDHYLHGLVTLKGHKLINKYKNLKEDE